ncbi:unnamed protein product [Arctogadus glacialis]
MKAVYFLDNWNKDPCASRTVNDNAEEMASLNNNMAQCHQELQSMPLDLTETGRGLKFQAERPHLVSLGSGRLSTAVTLLPLAEGRTTLGHGSADIALQGPGVAAQHGYIENLSGRVTLHPCGNHCSVDGLSISRPVRLSQGMLRKIQSPRPAEGATGSSRMLLCVWDEGCVSREELLEKGDQHVVEKGHQEKGDQEKGEQEKGEQKKGEQEKGEQEKGEQEKGEQEKGCPGEG